MENKINIAELLKDCPKGMELYSPIFGEVYLDKIRPHLAIVVTTDKEQGDIKEEFLYDGRYGINGECMLYPSKGKTTWEGFAPPCEFKDGDIVISTFGDIHLLSTEDSSYCSYRERWRGLPKFDETITTGIKVDRLATEKEKQELFDAIKSNGYKWNEETKTLEKLVVPKFKVDDKIKLKGGDEFGIITEVADCFYTIKCKNNTHYWAIKKQDDWELINEPKFKDGDIVAFDTEKGAELFIFKEYIHNHYYAKSAKCYMMLDCGGQIDFESGSYYVERLATEEEKARLFQAIKDNGYKWNEETKTLKELIEPKFKVGDIIKYIYFDRKVAKVIKIHDNRYELDNGKFIEFQYENAYEISYDKFDITTLKPFDKVLVRNTNKDYWRINMFGYISKGDKQYFMCTANSGFYQCIPYEENKHLLGTTDDCDEYYKTWGTQPL